MPDAGGACEAMDRPNVLWICTDQQRNDTLGCSGNPFVRSPNIDSLSRTGIHFERAYCQSPVCAPSRGSFLTGRYPRTTRLRQNGQSIPADERLVTRILADAGYVCGLVGKLHLSACHPRVLKSTERRIDDGYSVFHWSHHPMPDWPANEYIHWLRERGLEYSVRPFPECDFVKIGPEAPYSHSAWCADKAIDFIEAQSGQGTPWLLSVNLFDPHHPFDPPLEFLERYRDVFDEIPLPNYREGELDDKPVWQRIDHRGAYGGRAMAFTAMNESDHRWVRAAYWAMCDLVDVQVGRILAALERTGQRENTLVIFMSDHGEMLGDHGIYLKGPYFYEPAVNVPLIISWPGRIPEGRRSPALVELVDLAPTLLEACGIEPLPGMQGRSLWPLLCGDAPVDRHREDVYCEFYGANFSYDPPAETTMLRTSRYKVTIAHGQGTGELYDLERDPLERMNLWNEPEYAGVRFDLMMRLLDRMAGTCDPLPPREAPW